MFSRPKISFMKKKGNVNLQAYKAPLNQGALLKVK